jgi:pentatricopeptide repeat-containing protein PET309
VCLFRFYGFCALTRQLPLDRACSFPVREVVARRDRPFRRHPSHHLPHSTCCRIQNRSKLECVHASQRRHVSTVPELQRPPVRSPVKPALETFRSTLKVASDCYNLDSAWNAYNTVVASGALASVTPKELLVFANGMVASAENYYDRSDPSDDLKKWGTRLRDLLVQLEAHTTPHSPEEHTRICLLSRAHALRGTLKDALLLARSVSRAVDVSEEDIVPMWKAISRSKMLLYGAASVVDLVVTYWDFFSRHLSSRVAANQSSEQASLRHTVYAILATIDDPLQELSKQHWDDMRRTRAGLLLIEAFCHERLPEDGLRVLEEMQRQELSVPVVLQLSLVRALARADAFEPANRLFSSLSLSLSRQPNFKYYLSTALYLFAHQGNITRAEDYYDQIKQAHGGGSPIDKAMLMYAYATQGKTEEVVGLFNRFFVPTDRDSESPPSETHLHYSIVIFAHARRGDLDGMNSWLETMSQAGYPLDAYVYNMILKAFAMRGEVDTVAGILNRMRAAGVEPSHISYTSVITLLAHRQDPVAAEAIYRRAIREGVVPDRRMITSLMNAHVEAGSWTGVIRAFDYIASSPSRHIRPSIEVFNTLLKAYVLIGAPFSIVSALFIKLGEIGMRPDEFTFALLTQSACDAGEMNAASEILAELDGRANDWKSNLQVTPFVLTIMMAAFLRRLDAERAKAVYEEMIRRGIQPTSVTYGTIIKAFSNIGTEESLQMAEEFINTLVSSKRGQRTWDQPMAGRASALEMIYRPVMNAYARREQPEDVVRLYKNMLEVGGEPTLGLLTALLDAYRRTGNVVEVLRVWPQIFRLGLHFSQVDDLFDGGDHPSPDSDIPPRYSNILCVPLSIFIDAASAAGLHAQVAMVWKQLKSHGFAFDSHNWNHLVVALIRAGEPERAFEVLEKVILPYQRRTNRLSRKRTSNPVTPLTFDFRPVKDNAPGPPSEALRRTRTRASAARAFRKNWLNSTERMDDFAHPLHILHQVSLTWNIWKPHPSTLHILSHTLMRLESGSIIRPVASYGEEDRLEKSPEQAHETSELARTILSRLYENCPNAVRVVSEFDLYQNHRAKVGPYG